MADPLQFEWEKARNGHEIVRYPRAEGGGLHVKRRSGPVDLCRSLELPGLYATFAGLDHRPEAVRSFADTYGLLNNAPGFEEPVAVWYRHADAMAEAIELKARADYAGVCGLFDKNSPLLRATFFLAPREARQPPALMIRPRDLLAAMWLQLALAIAANVGLRYCELCAKPFEFGTGTGRRSSARFCSDNCRKVAHLQKSRETGK
jgi:hypothetical protein